MERDCKSHITSVEPETVARPEEGNPLSPQEEAKVCDADICEAIDSILEIMESTAKSESPNPIQIRAISPAEVKTDMDYSPWKSSDQCIQMQANMCPDIDFYSNLSIGSEDGWMNWEDAPEPINISRTTPPTCSPSVTTIHMTYPVPNTNNVERIEIEDADSDSSVEHTMDCEATNNVSPTAPQPGSGLEEEFEDTRSQLPPEAVAHSSISDAGSSKLEILPTENYPGQIPIQGMNDKNIRIIYATASAHAEEGDEEAGIPPKVRLLYAEALGYGGNAAEPLQLVYAAARPNQHFEDSDSRVVETMPARYVSTPPDWNYSGERVQEMFAQQKPTYSEPLSMEVVAGSGSAIAQCYVDNPENLSLVSRAQNLQGLIPRSHTETERQCDVMNAFLYSNLETANERTAEERAVETRNSWDAADRTMVTAAQAIATVGLAARLQREREIKTSNPSLSDNVPSPPSSEYNQGSGSRYHRGPRKRY